MPTGWNYTEVTAWRDGLLEYETDIEKGRREPSIAVFETDFDDYWVRIDTGEYGEEVDGSHVERDEIVDKMVSLAAEYNVREFMEGLK